MNRVWLPLLLALCQCVSTSSTTHGGGTGTDGSPGSATAAGSVNSTTLSPASALFGVHVTNASAGASQTTQAQIMISSDAEACQYYQDGPIRTGNQALELIVLTDGSESIATGSYLVGSSSESGANVAGAGNASFYVADESGTITQTGVTSGSITVSTSNSSLLAGTYNLTFGSSSISGRFSAEPCSGLPF